MYMELLHKPSCSAGFSRTRYDIIISQMADFENARGLFRVSRRSDKKGDRYA